MGPWPNDDGPAWPAIVGGLIALAAVVGVVIFEVVQLCSALARVAAL